ncbi:MAG: hypothetical protein ACI8P3_002453 [Saprospiraceae bacterium]|jgi:hypothetical protein
MINLYSIRPKGFNIGNDVIYLGINHFIREAFKENYNVISLPATGKYENQKKAGLSAQTIYEINRFGSGVIIGGGNLYENGELEVNQTALKALERPMMIFSVSRGKVYNEQLELVNRTDVMTDATIKMINDRADISMSRDKATKAHIDSLGCKNIVGGCPTLFINEMPQHLVPISKEDQTDVLISIRTPTLMSVPVSFQYELRGQMQEMINMLKTKGYSNIKILCHDHRDIPFAASFGDVDYLYTEDVYTYLTYLKNTKLNVTFRLHSFIPCLAYDIPTIKISYDQRAISMLDTLGMDDWNINYVKDNVLKEVEHRIDNMGDLDNMKKTLNAGLWKENRAVISDNCAKFVDMVKNQI